jgi:hypothetical protein
LSACTESTSRHRSYMSTADLIAEKARTLPAPLQREALRYVDYLLACQAEGNEARDWTRFSAEQLASQYSVEDTAYDRD